MIDRSIGHLEASEAMMRDAKGNLTALAEAVMHYRHDHRDELRTLRDDGERLLGALSADERTKVTTAAAARARAVFSRVETLSKTFKEPKAALSTVRPLTIAASPKPRKPGTISILPAVPPLPGAGTPTGAHVGHVH